MQRCRKWRRATQFFRIDNLVAHAVAVALELNWIESNQIRLNSIEFNQIKSNWIKSNWIKSNWIESNWIQSNQIELNQIKSNSIKSNWIQSSEDDCHANYLLTIGGGATTVAVRDDPAAERVDAGTVISSRSYNAEDSKCRWASA